MNRQQKYFELFEYAQICWASYSTGFNVGMFGDKERQWGDINSEIAKQKINNKKTLPTYHQALSESQLFFLDKYNVGFDSKQADTFVNRYEILAFSQDDKTRFSATLFKDTKNDELILAIRGIDIFQINLSLWRATQAGFKIFRGKVPIAYYLSMLRFYDEHIRPIIAHQKIVVTGHSFGGYLAQLFALSYPSIVKKVYTFNAIGVTSNQTTDYTSKAVDVANVVTTQVTFDFSIYDSTIDEFKGINIDENIQKSIELKNGLLTFKDKSLKEQIPKYLQEEAILKEQNTYNIQTAKQGANLLYQEIQKAKMGDRVFVKVRLDGFLPHTMDTEVFTLNERMGEAVSTLIKYFPNSHNKLPKELQASIYQVYTTDAFDATAVMHYFGNHILATETIEVKLNLWKARIDFKDMIVKGKIEKLGLKGLKMASVVNWILVLISIEDICNELLKQSLVSNEVSTDYIDCSRCGWEFLPWKS
ncbi:hypothetical protein CQA53_09950 [Helicobacter didelphidarum]|uniref:Fungal lipase-like domain-containing protein n=1 Tax=Helicobacter didelphidarum TaxID=2040648 RepID=A0A3D8I978_9HELI|nr:hypothetical protein [Helicobacter didelphidarum]RDU61575.1 hypothetical protein CQA53_09950 [Helicobacter didelphidarum]